MRNLYDLNLTVPDITSPKYSDDNRFRLLKNYLYQLNETLSFALSDKTATVIEAVKKQGEETEEAHGESVRRLSAQSYKRFNELKDKIISTATEIERDYTAEITATENNIMQTVGSTYLAQSEFGDYKNTLDTKLTQTDGSLSLMAENIDSVSSRVDGVEGSVDTVQGNIDLVDKDLQEFKETASSEILIQADSIMSTVEKTFATKDETTQLESRVGSAITQTATDITESYTNTISETREEISSVGGSFAEFVSELDVYIRRGELEEGVYGIEIGRSDSNIKARFTNDSLSFYQGISRVAYITGSTLYITNAQILDYIKIGNTAQGYFIFDTTQNGLEVRWIDV